MSGDCLDGSVVRCLFHSPGDLSSVPVSYIKAEGKSRPHEVVL